MPFLRAKALLIVVLILAAFIRFYNLDTNPPGVHADEADTAYSAYSVLKTGLDPHGSFDFLALSDNNIGGTHPPLYTYILMPLIDTFGLNIFVERLPSAVFGTLTVFLVFLIVRKILNSESAGALAAFLTALNPWAIHISRQGLLEAQSLFFVLLGVTFFLYASRYKFFLILSGLAFGLSLYSYQAPRIFLPPFLALLFLYKKNEILKLKKHFIVFLVILAVFYSSILKLTFFDKDNDYNNRFMRSSIVSAVSEAVNSERYLTNAPLFLSSIFHNKLTTTLKRIQTSYVSIFSLNWFFINGDGNLQHSVGNHGEFYLFELPFFFIGLYLVYKKSKKTLLFLLAWMFLGALPGGLTTGNYVYRSVHVLPVPIIFSSFAILWFWNYLNNSKNIKFFLMKIGLVLVMLFYISSYLVTYFFDYPVYASESWAKQQNDAVKFAISQKSKYEKIFVDGGEPWALHYAYFTKLDPKVYQNAYLNQDEFNGGKVMKIDNFIFGHFQLQNIKNIASVFPSGSLLVTNASSERKTKPIKVFKDPGNVRVIFRVFIVP